MPVFNYKALSAAGKAVSGMVDADSIKTAKAKLRKDGLFPTEFSEMSDKKTLRGKGLGMEIDIKAWRGRVGLQDLAMTTRQLATLAAAGIPLVDSIGALASQVEDVVLRKALTNVRDKVNEGSSLAHALEDYPKIFSPLFVNMVNAGENSGTLDIVLARLADFTESQMILRQKIRSAMIYPVMMLVISSGIISYLVAFVIPKISKIFEGMHKALPMITLALLGGAKFVQHYWWLIIMFIIAVALLFRRWKNSENGRPLWDRFTLRVPILGKLIHKIAIGRFSRTLATLLKSGVPIIAALDIVKNVVNNKVLEKAVETARENVKEGEAIAKPLERSGVFPPLVIHMIHVGETTGELENMLFRVADAYEGEVAATINGLTAVFEPIMLLVMAGFVGFAVIAIMLPIMDMTSGLQ